MLYFWNIAGALSLLLVVGVLYENHRFKSANAEEFLILAKNTQSNMNGMIQLELQLTSGSDKFQFTSKSKGFNKEVGDTITLYTKQVKNQTKIYSKPPLKTIYLQLLFVWALCVLMILLGFLGSNG